MTRFGTLLLAALFVCSLGLSANACGLCGGVSFRSKEKVRGSGSSVGFVGVVPGPQLVSTTTLVPQTVLVPQTTLALAQPTVAVQQTQAVQTEQVSAPNCNCAPQAQLQAPVTMALPTSGFYTTGFPVAGFPVGGNFTYKYTYRSR